jgi:hypothetical protein
MAIYSGYSGAPGAGDTTAAPSQNLWAPVDAGIEKPGRWFHTWNDFDNLPFTTLPTTEGEWGDLKFFSSTGGYFTAVDVEGGVRKIGSDGDNEGAAIGMASFPYKIIQNAGELVFEARIKTATLATDICDMFVGLIESVAFTAAVPCTSTQGLISDNNMVGFYRDSTTAATSALLDTTYKANTVAVVNVKEGAITLVADTWVKVGMVFNRGGDNVLRFYKDGIELVNNKAIPSTAGDDFPNDVRMGWVLGVTNTTAPAATEFISIDWIRVAQKRVSAPA